MNKILEIDKQMNTTKKEINSLKEKDVQAKIKELQGIYHFKTIRYFEKTRTIYLETNIEKWIIHLNFEKNTMSTSHLNKWGTKIRHNHSQHTRNYIDLDLEFKYINNHMNGKINIEVLTNGFRKKKPNKTRLERLLDNLRENENYKEEIFKIY